MELWEPEDSLELARAARRLIQERTRRGIGADGQPFRALEDGSSTNLRRTGRMLDGLEVARTSRGAAVRSDVDYARFVDAQRPFLALIPDQLDELDREAEAILERRERRL